MQRSGPRQFLNHCVPNDSQALTLCLPTELQITIYSVLFQLCAASSSSESYYVDVEFDDQGEDQLKYESGVTALIRFELSTTHSSTGIEARTFTVRESSGPFEKAKWIDSSRYRS